MGTMVVAVLAVAGGGFCGASCPKAGEMGPPTSVTANKAANSGRANSVFIVLLTLEIVSPKGLNLFLLHSVKRSRNGFCFKKSAARRSHSKFTCSRAHPPQTARRPLTWAARRQPEGKSSLAGVLFLDNAGDGS